MLTQDEVSTLDRLTSDKANTLIRLGRKEWYKVRRKGKLKNKKSLEDQLREIEDNMVEDQLKVSVNDQRT